MRLFNRILLTASFTFAIFSLVTYTACKQDKCKGVACLNGGACQDGACICPTGYTGSHCETSPVQADPCYDIVCQNGGTCSGGTCSCPSGYEGTYCETLVRTRFIRSWVANDVNTADNTSLPQYNVTISAGPAANQILISGMSAGYFTHDVVATVQGNTFTIASQQPDNDGYKISGSGTLSTDHITCNYTILNPANATVTYNGNWH